jgi:hypothetical protein
MKITSVFVTSFLLQVSSVLCLSNFERDIVHRQTNRNPINRHARMNDDLLSKAMPIAEYEAGIKSRGGHVARKLPEDDEDDFYLTDDVMYSFSGYSLKYALCQPVQYFSENAISAGEHSPMVTEDIVILRLCPQKSCTSSAIYGCHYNFAEYAISLSDYLAIMLKYSAKTLESTCQWCEACQQLDDNGEGDENKRRKQRKLQEDDEGVEEEHEEEDYAEADVDDYLEEEQDQQAQQANDDYSAKCPDYNTYCSNYQYDCDPDLADDTYINVMDYQEIEAYLNCVEVKYNNYAYYVRPRCDGYDGTMKMGVFYDQFCVQHAGSDVTIKDMGLGLHEGIFEQYYSGTCIECSVDDESYPPYFDKNGALCNKIHYTSAICTSDMTYNLFDGYQSSDSECSYIESIRYGTYDETGKLSAASVTNGVTWTTEISVDQKIMLAFSVSICIILVLYACYIHHSMTNLLIKSLSHRELLPPSRHRSHSKSRRTGPNAMRAGVNGRNNIDDDWEKPQIV